MYYCPWLVHVFLFSFHHCLLRRARPMKDITATCVPSPCLLRSQRVVGIQCPSGVGHNPYSSCVTLRSSIAWVCVCGLGPDTNVGRREIPPCAGCWCPGSLESSTIFPKTLVHHTRSVPSHNHKSHAVMGVALKKPCGEKAGPSHCPLPSSPRTTFVQT